MEANLKSEFEEMYDTVSTMIRNNSESGICPSFITFSRRLKHENVTGVIATNENGLCLMASPNVDEDLSGVWYSIARLASKIESSGEDPLINFQGETKQCLIKREGSVTTTVFLKTK